MNLISRVVAMLILVSIAGCSQDDKPVKSPETGLLKSQMEALERAKHVEQDVQDSAELQRQKIEKETQ
jgi:predicted small lipoprotein YifL